MTIYDTIGLNRKDFVYLNYSTPIIKGLSDPNLIRTSIVCSIHPDTINLMPVINKWIARFRGAGWKAKKREYRKNLDNQIRNSPHISGYYFLAGQFPDELMNGTADNWYSQQQKFFPKLKLFPNAKAKIQTPLI